MGTLRKLWLPPSSAFAVGLAVVGILPTIQAPFAALSLGTKLGTSLYLVLVGVLGIGYILAEKRANDARVLAQKQRDDEAAQSEERQRRLEFMHEKNQPIAILGFRLSLKESVSISQLPHVRVFLWIAKITRNVQRSQWNVGVCDNAPIRDDKSCGAGPCLISAFWLANPANTHGSGAATRSDPFNGVGASGGFSELSEPKIVATLAELDDSYFAFFMNRSLFDRIARIRIFANEYLIWSGSSEELAADEPNEQPRTPWLFTPAELSDPWVRVMPKGSAGSLHFSDITPRRLWDAKGLDEPA